MVLWYTIQGAMATMPFAGADVWHRRQSLRVVCGSLGALNMATGNGDDVVPNADVWHRRPSSWVVCGGLGAVPPLCSPWSSSFNLDKLGVVERVRTRCYLTHNTGKAKLINLMVCDH
ncbi:hypothetical protein QYE76_043342 [Lolium multiflorum]|uniref:Uncharacterized protein n=1 Tax=Lolium multiflorum TaxID=4521 RepID=A0AAD8TGY4_LOLMU|nr:hypothetical protein QYE76_043342 [Lolium multiflorum]